MTFQWFLGWISSFILDILGKVTLKKPKLPIFFKFFCPKKTKICTHPPLPQPLYNGSFFQIFGQDMFQNFLTISKSNYLPEKQATYLLMVDTSSLMPFRWIMHHQNFSIKHKQNALDSQVFLQYSYQTIWVDHTPKPAVWIRVTNISTDIPNTASLLIFWFGKEFLVGGWPIQVWRNIYDERGADEGGMARSWRGLIGPWWGMPRW